MQHLEDAPPLAVARGEGAWLVTAEGKRVFDGISSWWVNLFGHCHPHINSALMAQLQTLEHVMLAGCTHAPVVELSERLAALTGLGHAFYGSDGASATEIALKMSVHAWRNQGRINKHGFISLQNGYHGETAGALSVTDIPLFKSTYAPLLRPTAQLPSPDARLAAPAESPEVYALRCAQALEAYLARHAESTAAFILEPLVQGAAGMAMYAPVYLQRARELCDRYQVHLIADEIAVGFGRTGTLFACEQASVRADFLCLSKGLTGGYLPLSVVLTRDAIYQSFYDDDTARGFLHSHSYTGNPLACRAALAVLELFDSENVLAENQRKAEAVNARLGALTAHERVRHFRQIGMIWAFDVVDAPADFAPRFAAAALAQGALLRPIGNTVYFMPPYIATVDEIIRLGDISLAILESLPRGAAEHAPALP
jgi:adenosylmethionine-8-amino-7-oxononanoate aminotransferase